LSLLKRIMVGRPLATTEQEHQRLTKTVALAVFSSDAISSTAYATQEILFVTAVGASSLALGLSRLVPISIAVAVLLVVVVISYRQTIFAYPSGGGSYIVSRENLGEYPALVAGGSLLVDYILTVAVSISAGVAAIVSIPALHSLADYKVELCLGLISFITVMNLRGVKESGRIFAVPTYAYIIVAAALIVWGLLRWYLPDVFGAVQPVPFNSGKAIEGLTEAGGAMTLLVLLRGFSSGAVALSGVEAISNGVPAFKRPESKNAAVTLMWMGLILGSLFFGMSLLASHLQPYPSEIITVPAQLGLQVFGNGVLFWVLQVATALILILAANTAYADFPRLSSIIAKDGYLPRQLTNRGDRLVFSNGVLVLAVMAAILVTAFGGETNLLIPLYAVGVFTAFTLSQSGMVRHHLKERERHWRIGLAINAVGAVMTFVVLLVVGGSKFTQGAWIPIVIIPLIVALFKGIKNHYARVRTTLAVGVEYKPKLLRNTVVVLVGNVHRGVLDALAYARSLRPDHLVAATVVVDEEEEQRAVATWESYRIDMPLEVLYSPYRELDDVILRFVDQLDAQYESDIITVVMPEFVVKHWWENILHNQSAFVLKLKLLFRKNTVVTSVPYHVDAPPSFKAGSVSATAIGGLGALFALLTPVFDIWAGGHDGLSWSIFGMSCALFAFGAIQAFRSVRIRRAWWGNYVAMHPEATAISEVEAEDERRAAILDRSGSRWGGIAQPPTAPGPGGNGAAEPPPSD